MYADTISKASNKKIKGTESVSEAFSERAF